MTKRKYFYTSILFALTLFSGCKKYLDQLPDERAELNSPEKVAEFLATAYPKANYIPFLETMTDNAEDKGLATVEMKNRQSWLFEDITERSEDTPDFYWQAAYQAIAVANLALEAINNAENPEAYSSSKGEALVARAYSHFMLVTLFSKPYDAVSSQTDPGVPYVTEPEKVVIKKYERKTVAYVYEQIEKDLLEGLPLLRDNTYKEGAERYHFTTTAAHAFASRFYLFKKQYQKVIDHASKAFVGGNITTSLRPINSAEYRGLEPLVKLAEYTKATTLSNLLLVETPSVWARDVRTDRFGFTVDLLQGMIWGDNPTTGIFGAMFYGNSETLFTPKFREHFLRQDPNSNVGNAYVMVPLFSSEEVLFNRAEANAELGNNDAVIQDLNDFAAKRFIVNDRNQAYYDPALLGLSLDKIKSFYGYADTKQALVKTILDFKRMEFVSEGVRWFDIIRHKLPIVHVSLDRQLRVEIGPNDPRRVLQLPQEAQSSGLELNPR